MSKKLIGILSMAGGAMLFVLSLIADPIGIGSYPGINSAQLIGAAVGFAVLVIGYWLRRANGKSEH